MCEELKAKVSASKKQLEQREEEFVRTKIIYYIFDINFRV